MFSVKINPVCGHVGFKTTTEHTRRDKLQMHFQSPVERLGLVTENCSSSREN